MAQVEPTPSRIEMELRGIHHRVQADFVKPGIIWGYRTMGDYGLYSDGEGNAYCFGRSRLRCFIDLDVNAEDAAARQKQMLKERGRRTGLNMPCTILMWVQVGDVDRWWDESKQELRRPKGSDYGEVVPEITNQLDLGDNFFTVSNLNPTEFGEWCCKRMQRLLVPPRVLQILVEV